MTTILQQLKQYADEDPNDPFNLYALALEYQKSDITNALTIFAKLTSSHPNYVATYYQLGKLYQHIGELDLAKKTLEQGMSVALAAGNHKTHRELQSALQELDDDC